MMLFVSLAAAALLVVIDQLSKMYITNHYEIGQIKELISIAGHKMISITHVRNSGAAWSIMEGKTVFLVVLPIILIVGIIVLMIAGKIKSKLEYASIALIIAGGVGNLIDRIRFHEVVDFIKWEVFKFPVFNFADICVVCGAILLCVYFVFFDKSDSKTDSKTDEVKDTEGSPKEDNDVQEQ